MEMMFAGHMCTALSLAIYFSPEQGGSKNKKLPEEGEAIDIRPAYYLDSEEVTFLGYVGKSIASCGFWQSCDEHGRTLMYVNLNALAPAGIKPLFTASYIKTDKPMWNGNAFEVLDFTDTCLENLWQTYGLREHLFGTDGLVWQYPGARFIFNGYSHGTPMAQGVALLFSMECERLRASGQLFAAAPEAYIIAWNGYRWTQERGQQLMRKYLGDHNVLFVSVRRHQGHAHFDPTSGYPDDGVNSDSLYGLDVDSSLVEKISRAPDITRAMGARLGLQWLAMHSIHIKAIKRMTAVYGLEDDEDG